MASDLFELSIVVMYKQNCIISEALEYFKKEQKVNADDLTVCRKGSKKHDQFAHWEIRFTKADFMVAEGWIEYNPKTQHLSIVSVVPKEVRCE